MDPAVPVRKRRRTALSCVECRRRKLSCDRNDPCTRCTTSGATCVHDPEVERMPQTTKPAPVPHSRVSASIDQLSYVTPSPSDAGYQAGQRSHSNPYKSVSGVSNVAQTLRVPKDHNNGTTQQKPAQAARQASQSSVVASSEQPPPPAANRSSEFVTISSSPQIRGTLSKNRLLGPSHWMNTFTQFEVLRSMTIDANWNDDPSLTGKALGADIPALLQNCKNIAKTIKAGRPTTIISIEEAKCTIPCRELANVFVDNYFRTFESVFRVLHVPSFLKEYSQYWDGSNIPSTTFVANLLLVLSVGTRFHPNEAVEIEYRSLARQWILAVQSWVSVPLKKQLFTLPGLQTQCLLLLAGQVHGIAADLTWVAAGTLLRSAMIMGLHRDPANFPQLSVLQIELRRRIWTTVVEFDVQAAMDAGTSPTMAFDEFDTRPPLNIDDDKLDDTVKAFPASRESSDWTQTSLQIILRESLRTRYEIARLVNIPSREPAYEDVLRLSVQMVNACRKAIIQMQATPSVGSRLSASPFQRNITNHLLRRFTLALHRPFAIKAARDPRFFFSRKTCVDNVLGVLDVEPDDDFHRLQIAGRGVFQEVPQHAAITLCLELITHVEDDRMDPTSLQRNKVIREPLIATIKNYLAILEQRLKFGETNVKAHVFISMALAQIEALESGLAPKPRIIEAAKASLSCCADLLRACKEPTAEHHENGGHNESLPQDLVLSDDDAQFLYNLDTNLDFSDPTTWLFPSWDQNQWVRA